MKLTGPILLSALALAACGAPPPPPPPPTLPGTTVTYTCTGNTHLTVVYGNGTATLSGHESLIQDEGAAGQSYSWPGTGSHHVWAIGADGLGTLSVRDGATGTPKVVQSGCKADAQAKG